MCDKKQKKSPAHEPSIARRHFELIVRLPKLGVNIAEQRTDTK